MPICPHLFVIVAQKSPNLEQLKAMDIAVFAGCACGTLVFLLFLQYLFLAMFKRALAEERRKLANERRKLTEVAARALSSLGTSEADGLRAVEELVALAEHDLSSGIRRRAEVASRCNARLQSAPSRERSSVAACAPNGASASVSAAKESSNGTSFSSFSSSLLTPLSSRARRGPQTK